MNTPVILYHGGGCHDGFTSAWVAHKFFGNDCKFIPCRYGEPPYSPGDADGAVYLIDFSYKAPAMERLSEQQAKRRNRLVVLDHHKTALKELAAWVGAEEATDETVFLSYGGPEDPVELTFDLNECGSTLTWDHFFPGQPRPRLLEYVRDRDLWKRELPNNEEIRAYMETLMFDFSVWDILRLAIDDPPRMDNLITRGRTVLRYKYREIDQAVSHAAPVELSGRPGWAVNSTVQFSEVAGKLAAKEGSTFGCAYFRRDDGKWQYSLRARGEYTVDDLARERGGGGHKQASGFESKDLIF